VSNSNDNRPPIDTETQKGFQDLMSNFMGAMRTPMPGMFVPTVDVEELEKKIADLKSVENWLKMNLQVLQATIQGLEMQKMTLDSMKQVMEKSKKLNE
jgi:hypothetical protein